MKAFQHALLRSLPLEGANEPTMCKAVAPPSRVHLPEAPARVFVILVNWNGWRDTIECLESLLRSDYPSFAVIVCDNASTDNSVERIEAWASGAEQAGTRQSELSYLSSPPVSKPISFVTTTPDMLDSREPCCDCRLILLKNGSNDGFAAGNNAALRWLMACREFDYVWLLNNDTVVRADALSEIIKRIQNKANVGICGSTLLDYSTHGRVQCYGGASYNRWSARSFHIGHSDILGKLPDADVIEKQIDYVVGASMLVSRPFLLDVGLMSEDYFLYFEELDWAMRAKRKYRLAYAPKAIVYHKLGQSAGTARRARSQSALAEYYSTLNRILITRRYFRYAVPAVYACVMASAVDRAIHRRWHNLQAVLKAVLGRSLGGLRPSKVSQCSQV